MGGILRNCYIDVWKSWKIRGSNMIKNIMKDIFISFSTKDLDTCRSVCRWLGSNGLTYWVYFDHKSDNYHEKIYKGIKNCKHCILLISDNSMNSQDIAFELGVVTREENKKRGMTIFPVYIDEIKN